MSHGYPAMRTFRVVRLLPRYNAVEIDPAGTTIQPVVSLRHCVKAPSEWWVINDMSPGSGIHNDVATSLRAVRANPYEVGGRLRDTDEVDDTLYQVEWVYDARKSKGKWWYHISWIGYPDTSWVHESDVQISDPQLLRLMELSRERYDHAATRARATTTRTRDRDDDEDSEDDDDSLDLTTPDYYTAVTVHVSVVSRIRPLWAGRHIKGNPLVTRTLEYTAARTQRYTRR